MNIDCKDFYKHNNIGISSKNLRNDFKSYTDMLVQLGIRDNQFIRNIPDKLLFAEVKRLAKQLDKTPTSNDMMKYGKYSYNVYRKRFGVWNNVLKKLDFKLYRNIIEEKELIQEYERLKNKLGRVPYKGDFSNKYRNSFCKISGNYTNFVIARKDGEYLKRNKVIKKQSLINALKLQHKKLGRIPELKKFFDISGYSNLHIKKYWNDWYHFVSDCGFTPNFDFRKTTKKELIKYYFEYKKILGRQPKQSDFKIKHGAKYSLKKYIHLFNGWNIFLKTVNEPTLMTTKHCVVTKKELIDDYWRMKKKIGKIYCNDITLKNGFKRGICIC